MSLAGAELVVGSDGRARPPWAATDPLLRDYYDTEWGLPVTDERGVFERLSLEAFQAGLSWRTILARRPGFRAAFADFEVDAVAAFDESDVSRLLADERIIRQRRKIEATVRNARAAAAMRDTGGLAAFVWSFRPSTWDAPLTLHDIPTQTAESRALADGLRAQGFSFVGPTTMFALMEAIGIVDTHLPGAHRPVAAGDALGPR
ncbi:DNA-3-methyladenine glycosylase I [Pseudoclavibacter sp. CFCC 11306]|uniref:DNA-3-methyladenine glycosylase I n=1 Tax=Pseudoclavibacter sp. CFCC 11306 TaxID=1564493 RepID=UPI001300D7B9|nr:DNA-3-methyladenine glycosylase I [Pseudoclavibacter sp. CFCC 11306]KAB1658694.1 DNA-3-methyladenine glycosylase I [Pseudoclavibacter sp. CFCC 11306]